MTANALSLDSMDSRARVVGHVDLVQESEAPAAGAAVDDDFLGRQAASPWTGDQLQRDLDRVLAEVEWSGLGHEPLVEKFRVV